MAPSHARHARRLGLVIVETDSFSILRRKRGQGFRYLDERTGRSPGREARVRIEALGIPPAWRDVRCAGCADAHIQALGEDGDGRRQYVYNPRWTKVRDAVKAERLLRFGRALPQLRERVSRDLRGEGGKLCLRRVSAAAARLVDRGAMRPGNEVTALAGHRGATTLTRRNVRVEGDRIELDYVGKSGREHAFTVRDKGAARILRGLTRLPARRHVGRRARRGEKGRLFVYRAEDGRTRRLTAAKLNRYLAEAAGTEVSAKDFRTFVGSARALEILFEHRAEGGPEASEAARRRIVAKAVRAASDALRNTPAVARSSYVMPSLIEAFEAGTLADSLFRGPTRRGLDRAETALMRHVEGQLR